MYKKQHIHFVGIGGIGMSGLAHVLLTLGYRVTGSDLRTTDITRALEEKGGVIYRGHEPQYVLGADVVVTSSAIRDDNPEVEAARFAHIPVIPRAEMLAELMRLKKFGIAVAGAHGKTSTTSMVASVLREADFDPTVIIGGKLNGMGGSNAYWGKGEFLVAEADESDGSFLRLTPSIAVVTNIDREHLDHYGDFEKVKEAFAKFIDSVPFYGVTILCSDDTILADMAARASKRIITYGTDSFAELQARNIKYEGTGVIFDVWCSESELGFIRLPAPGLHHVRNSLAAIAVGLELDIPFEQIKQGLRNYGGVGRRFDILGEVNGITVMDDYAHHPTEIQATLTAARAAWPDRRIVVLFEPHRYSRTKDLMDEFPPAFREADELWLADIYPASEEPIVGVTGRRLATVIKSVWGGPVNFVEKCADLPHAVVPTLKPGDVAITMGAGSIGGAGRKILELLRASESSAKAAN